MMMMMMISVPVVRRAYRVRQQAQLKKGKTEQIKNDVAKIERILIQIR